MSLAVVLLPILCAPFILASAAASWLDCNNDVISWADDDLPIMQQFQTFVQHFGRPELIVVSWPGCRADSEQLAELADLLHRESPDWFVNIATTQSVLDKLSNMPGGLDHAEIEPQLHGILLGPDGRLACLFAELGPTGRDRRPEAMEKIKALATQIGITREELKLGGMGPELAALDYESAVGLAELTPITGLCMIVLCVFFLRSLTLGLFIAALGGFVGALSGALVPWCGVQSDAILTTMPTLGGLLTISLALHFVGYYRKAREEITDPQNALNQAFDWAWKPTLISAFTTALGLGSLILSRTLTIQHFGIFGAMTTLIAAGLVLSVVPAFLQLSGHRLVHVRQADQHGRWLTWVSFIQSNARLIIVVVLIVACVVGSGLRF